MDQSLGFATRLHNDYIAGTAYRLLSQYYAEDRQQPQEAIRTGLLALQYLTRTGNQVDLASTDQRLAVAYEEEGDHASAIRYQQAALTIGKKTGSLQIEKYSLLGLSEIAEKQHHYDQVASYLHRYIAVKDTIARQANERQINELEARYQTLRKEEEIGRLEAQDKISHLQINRQWILIGMLVGGIVVLVIIAGLVYVNIRRRQLLQRQQIRELEKERQLVAVRSVLKGEEEERSRLARDLHDGVGGLLSGVKFSLSAMKGNVYLPEEQVQAFNHAVDQLDQSIGELRRVSHNMMPESLIKFGLTEALANYCENLNLSGKIRVQFQVYGLTQRPGPDIEVILYRMVQELLNNVIRHAGATTVLVQLMQEEDRFHLTVEDNGKGFDVGSVMDGRGAGLANVRARVDYLGGRLDIRSAPGEGTSVSVEGPLSTS